MNSKGLASEMIAELQESIGVLQERADLKERCIQNVLEIEDSLTLHYLAVIMDLLKKNRTEVGGADAYICGSFFNLVEFLEQNPDEKTAKLIYEVIQSLRKKRG